MSPNSSLTRLYELLRRSCIAPFGDIYVALKNRSMETMMTNDQRTGEKAKELSRKLFELQCELAEYQSNFCAYDQGNEIRATILAIDVLLMQLIEFNPE